ncbi:hypothetical protein ACFL19_00050 [Pseudomonadota bacterium]
MGYITIVLMTFCVIGIIAAMILWHAPRRFILKPDVIKLFENEIGYPPSRKLLNKFGLLIESLFYLSGAGLLLIAIIMLIQSDETAWWTSQFNSWLN